MSKLPKEFYPNFKANQDNLFLVSYRRSGCHYLMYLLYEYFKQPILLDSCEILDGIDIPAEIVPGDCLLMHSHDDKLTLKPNNVIILSRNAVDTIFSNLVMLNRMQKLDWFDFDEAKVITQCQKLSIFRSKWNGYTGDNVLYINYDHLIQSPEMFFRQVIGFVQDVKAIDKHISEIEIKNAIACVTKEHVMEMTKNKPQISSNNLTGYSLARQEFSAKYGQMLFAMNR